MSRSQYSDDCDGWDLIRWRGAVKSSIRGKRGQAFIRELIAALDAMPDKRLIAEELESDGAYCALGIVGHVRGIDMRGIDPEDRECVSKTFGIAEAMAAEIMYENDEYFLCTIGAKPESPEHRWQRMRKWAESNLVRPK
jgi:hypothetical protein